MRYPGGKGKCYQRLINLMPAHSTYIESHLGGGAVLRHKRPAAVNIGIDLAATVIERWRRDFPDLCTLVRADAASFLAGHAYVGEELVYADPPYLPETRRRQKVYRHDCNARQHRDLLDVLTGLPCNVMVSGYESALYDDALQRWRKVMFDAKTHVEVRRECVWMNFDPPARLHDASHLGETFRDRQTIRRRHARMLDKFARMEACERHQLLELLNAQHGFRAERS